MDRQEMGQTEMDKSTHIWSEKKLDKGTNVKIEKMHSDSLQSFSLA